MDAIIILIRKNTIIACLRGDEWEIFNDTNNLCLYGAKMFKSNNEYICFFINCVWNTNETILFSLHIVMRCIKHYHWRPLEILFTTKFSRIFFFLKQNVWVEIHIIYENRRISLSFAKFIVDNDNVDIIEK